jgi:hypothetical protein
MRALSSWTSVWPAVALLAVMVVPPGQAGAQSGACTSTVRFASSSNTIYLSGPGTCTPEDLADSGKLGSADLRRDGTTWYLGNNLRLEGGARLALHGAAAGGSVDVRWGTPRRRGEPAGEDAGPAARGCGEAAPAAAGGGEAAGGYALGQPARPDDQPLGRRAVTARGWAGAERPVPRGALIAARASA